MKNQILIGTLLLALFMSCASLKEGKKEVKSEYFKIEIVQNGKVIKPLKNVVTLDKKPFKFKLTMYKTDAVFVSASWGKYYYDYPGDKNIFECNDNEYLEDCRFVSIKTGNEDKFNVNKDLYVGDEDYQMVWFYDETMEWHRLDRGVTVENGVIHAGVTVENIYDMDKRDERGSDKSEYNYKVEKMDKDIYMVFAHCHYESGMEQPEELQRDKFVIKFK